MTATIARLILAMLILPATGAVFILTFIAFVARSGGPGPPTVAAVIMLWMIVYAFVATYWIVLWQTTVKWTAARVWKTALAGLAALAGGAAFGLTAISVNRLVPPSIAFLLAGGTVPITWVLGTVVLWRETPSER